MISQKKIIEAYINAYNSFNIEGMIEHLHQNIVFKNITEGTVDITTTGIEEFKNRASSSKNYFSEREQKIISWKIENNIVILHIAYRGVLSLNLSNGEKSRNILELKGKSTFEFSDEKIIKIIDES